ncbi:MAG: hypothetical protein WCI76_00045 [bacterium]
MFKEYIAYLKDNPQGLWFKRKLYGWGWTPARWQGWVVLLAYVVGLVKIFIIVDAGSHSGSDTMISMALPFLLFTALLFFVCYKKGESPRWQWGWKK